MSSSKLIRNGDIPSTPRINSFFTTEKRRSKFSLLTSRVQPLTMVQPITSKSSSLYILNSLDLTTAFIGNVYQTRHRRLAAFGLVLWIVNLVLSFAFDFYEAKRKYGFAWVIVRAFEWVVFCVGTYFVMFKTLPWMKEGLRRLENSKSDMSYCKSLLKITMDVKRLQVFLLSFTIIAPITQYLIIKFADRSGQVTFNQSLSSGAAVFLHICRFVSSLHMLYAYGLFWCIACCVMAMTGHSMVEFQDRISNKLRSKVSSPTFRSAVTMFDERLQFVKSSSRSCVVLLFLLLFLTILSVMVNVYLFLYKNRFILYIWQALMPLGLAIYPMCTAAWVTKQYHWYFVAVVKAWAEYPEDSSSDSDNETAEHNETKRTIAPSAPPPPKEFTSSPEPSSGMRIHLPNTGHVPIDEPIDQEKREKLLTILRGSVRVVGRLQHRRKVERFNFEKYISYLHHVTPMSGFKIGILTVTWEKVSAAIFLLTSIVAVFLQETIFGQNKSKV